MVGGPGADNLDGGVGDDRLYGGGGGDQIFGEDGDDTIEASSDDIWIFGGPGSDVMVVGHGQAIIGPMVVDGGPGDDRIRLPSEEAGQASYLPAHVDGGDGNDQITGGQGNDFVQAAAGNDVINMSGGDDRVMAGAGDDLLWGSAGNDLLSGSIGADRLEGGSGLDLLLGGSGNDLFAVAFSQGDGSHPYPAGSVLEANDTVGDFVHGQDKLQISHVDWRAPDPQDPGAKPVSRIVGFAELDTNDEDVLDGSDQGVDLQRITVAGQAADSLVIDVAELTVDHPGPATFGVITLFGITAMTAADIHATTWPVPSA